ncbi:hypothetical protein Vadar_012023 [Vaccinium darrowii]|uniref:Uncharacterized protein n=1 Tax=Vaccinium darrowii TaxID=229202 RepID=A0ACB7YMC5_9ERIC|nr:hypothetical protein Vadar_012023 [Vaccinium darrowii]
MAAGNPTSLKLKTAAAHENSRNRDVDEGDEDLIIPLEKRSLVPRKKLLVLDDQEKCTDSGFKSLENKHKPIFLKKLKKLWEDPTLPWCCGTYSSSNTLLMDDEPYKALLNPPNTAIFPQSYKVDNGNDAVLESKGELRLFLDGLAEADDVPSYLNEHPIGQPGITDSHSNWDYYSKILRRFR